MPYWSVALFYKITQVAWRWSTVLHEKTLKTMQVALTCAREIERGRLASCRSTETLTLSIKGGTAIAPIHRPDPDAIAPPLCSREPVPYQFFSIMLISSSSL
jgi:hypothetical protein